MVFLSHYREKTTTTRRCIMPSIPDTEEPLTKILELPTHKIPQKTTTPRDGENIDELKELQNGWEKPLDILVRKNPYIYTDALFC